MTELSRDASRKISFWSFVFAVLAVVTHCAWQAESMLGNVAVFVVLGLLSHGLVIQFFFVVSGYLLARHFDEEGWWRREIVKRVRSLVVPYVLWTVVLAAVAWVETREVMGVGGFGLNPCKIPALAPLWYVRCLMLFILTLPVLLPALNRWKGTFLVGVYAAAVGAEIAAVRWGWSDAGGFGGFFAYGYSLKGLFYFLSGVFLQRHWHPSVSRKTYLLLLSVGLVLLILVTVLHFRGFVRRFDLCLLFVPPLLAGLWGVVRPGAFPSALAGSAFPIYIMHGVVLVALRSAGGTYRLCNPWLELALGVAVPVVFCRLVRRYARPVSAVLFGGR